MDKERILSKFPTLAMENMWCQIKDRLSEKKRDNPLIVIHGGYGKKNTGDDAILGIILNRISKHFKSPRFVVACHNSEEIKKLYPDIEAVSFKSVAMVKAIIKADIYVIGGGGIINKINSYSGFSRFPFLDPKGKFLFVAGAVAKILGAKLVFYSIGATSIPDTVVGIMASKVINYADFITVRDPLSKINLVTIGVGKPIKVVFDPVTSMKPCNQEKALKILEDESIEISGKSALLTFRFVNNPAVNNTEKVKEVAALTDKLAKQGYSVTFLPFGKHPSKKVENDLLFGKEVKKLISEDTNLNIIEGDYRPEELMGLTGLFDICILERLHAVIMARMMGKEVIAIAYDNKVSEFCKMSENHCIIPVEDFSAEKVLKEIALQKR